MSITIADSGSFMFAHEKVSDCTRFAHEKVSDCTRICHLGACDKNLIKCVEI